jgi:hypothetical protein
MPHLHKALLVGCNPIMKFKLRLRYIIIISFLTILVACFCNYVVSLLVSSDFSLEGMKYDLLMALIILGFPILVTIIIFKMLILKFSIPRNKLLKGFLQILCMFILLQSALLCWTLLDMQFFDFNYTYTTENIINAYKSHYLAFLPTTVLVPIFILFLNGKYNSISVRLKKLGV